MPIMPLFRYNNDGLSNEGDRGAGGALIQVELSVFHDNNNASYYRCSQHLTAFLPGETA